MKCQNAIIDIGVIRGAQPEDEIQTTRVSLRMKKSLGSLGSPRVTAYVLDLILLFGRK